jgi:transposase
MQTQDHDPRSASADCYVALELSRSKWLLGALLPGQEKVLTVTVSGGDADGLLAALAGIADKAARRSYPSVRQRVCFEAGYDGFWLAQLSDSRPDPKLENPSSIRSRKREAGHHRGNRGSWPVRLPGSASSIGAL